MKDGTLRDTGVSSVKTPEWAMRRSDQIWQIGKPR